MPRAAIPPLAALRHIAAFAGGVCAVVGSIGQSSAFGFGVTNGVFTAPEYAWSGVLISLGGAFCGAVGSVAFFSRFLSAALLFVAAGASFIGATWFATDTLPALARSGLAITAGGPIGMSWLLLGACPLFLLGCGLALVSRRAN